MQNLSNALSNYAPEKVRLLEATYQSLLLDACILPTDPLAAKLEEALISIAVQDFANDPYRLKEQALSMVGLRIAS